MNKYQFFAERKKLPSVVSRLITGNLMLIIGNHEGKTAFGAEALPETWWANQCRSKS